jgi:drug/metabolite transporter (DMT)-like permease
MSPNAKGILLMTISMAFLVIGDTATKLLSASYSPFVLIFSMGFTAVLIFGAIARLSGKSLWDHRALGKAALFRSIAEIAAALSMVIALGNSPFSLVTMVVQAMPLLVTIGAVIVFGEVVGLRRWVAIFVGFLGVVLIIGPGGAETSNGWIFPLLAAVALSVRDLASRAVPKEISTAQIAGWGGISLMIGGLLAHIISGDPLPVPQAVDILPFLVLVIGLAVGVFSVSAAMRLGDVSVVAPFRYTRLPFGLLISILFFDERLTMNMIAGTCVVVASGLYIWGREARVSKP